MIQLFDTRYYLKINYSIFFIDKLGTFLLSAADWIAIAVINVYYLVQLKKNEELEEIEEIEMSKLEEERKREKSFRKGVKTASTPKQSLQNL